MEDERMRRTLLLICILLIILVSGLYMARPSKREVRFETIEGMRISISDGAIYVLGLAKDGAGREVPYIEMVGGWSVTLDENLWVSNVLKCFDGRVYAAGVDIAGIEDGKVLWKKDLVEKKVSYEGTRESPIPVEHEYPLNVFDIESDGEFLYLNVREGIVKADGDLNVVWAVKLQRGDMGFGNVNDDISVSDGIYLTKGNSIIKLGKDGRLEWAISLKSREKISVEIPEGKRGAVGERFKELPRYSVELYAIHASEDVYVAGLVHERSHLGREETRPFLAKVSADGEVLWAEVLNVTYPGEQLVAKGKILRYGERFVAWISNYMLFIFDEDGRVTNFYMVKGYVSDLDVKDGTIYLAYPSNLVGGRKVEIEEKGCRAIPIEVSAQGLDLEVENVECHSKDWKRDV